ncbi:glycosyl hydrolase family protein [Raoultella ornithinolytica]|nr:glycosyl hydrolase family protein [Raoultella ornithinolytica]
MNNRLPADFLWGNSVSSMQTEGAWNEGGKGCRCTIFASLRNSPPTGKSPRTHTIVTGKIST